MNLFSHFSNEVDLGPCPPREMSAAEQAYVRYLDLVSVAADKEQAFRQAARDSRAAYGHYIRLKQEATRCDASDDSLRECT